MAIIVPIHTKRLELREYVESDWEAVHAYATHPDVARFNNYDAKTEDDTKNYLRGVISHQTKDPRRVYELAIILKSDGQLIGTGGLYIAENKESTAAIGFVIKRELWGQGYATEVANELLNQAFEKLSIHRVFSWCDTENLASARVLEKTGMRREGHMIHDRKSHGEWRDSYWYAILEDEWKSL